jgi:SAM-dependent methyltransferase
MRPAALAFDAAASTFDTRFGEWRSVAAQRTTVREALVTVFPPAGTILEIGGGTGEDAVWLAQRGFKLLSTDAAPTMVEAARRKLAPFGLPAETVAAEDLEHFADRYLGESGSRFDGAFSNFACLNCVDDLETVGRGLARLLRPGSAAVLVLFGKFSPGEIVVECLRRRPRHALRRLRRGAVPARIGGHDFTVRYHNARAINLAMHPWFRLVRRLGVGIFVPSSAAEPWISEHPGLLGLLSMLDRIAKRPLALLGDHVLYQFERTELAAP